MPQHKLPRHYLLEKKQHEPFISAVEALGKLLKDQGPLHEKTAHLVQLAAAVAFRSEGAVHSHVRRALDRGATAEEIHHAIIVLTTIIGFPTVSAALSWAEDIVRKK